MDTVRQGRTERAGSRDLSAHIVQHRHDFCEGPFVSVEVDGSIETAMRCACGTYSVADEPGLFDRAVHPSRAHNEEETGTYEPGIGAAE